MNKLGGLAGIAKITRTLASKSSMNPTLLLAALVVPLSLVLVYLSNGLAQQFFMLMSGSVVTVALLQILGFSIFAPQRLDDHKHVENLLIIQQKQAQVRQGDTTLFLPDSATISSNPKIEGGEI